MKSLNCLAALALIATTAHGTVVLEETSPGSYQLVRNGQPYYVKGAGYNNFVPQIAAAGGNSFRVWGVGWDTPGLLDLAQANGMTVAVGLWLNHGVNYNDPNVRAQQLAAIEQDILNLKDHPAVLVWGIGNEMEGYGDGNYPALWQHIENIAAMIHSIDPDHPTMTTIAEIGGVRVQQIHQYCPSLDIVGINSYGGAPSLPQRYRAAGGTKPYIVTEYAHAGTWETGYTPWGVPYEPTSASKGQIYHNVYDALAADSDLCLGGYAFVWGTGNDPTSTWYCTHLPDTSKLAVVDQLTQAWGGADPANHAPLITQFSLLGSAQVDGEQIVTAAIQLSDPDGDGVAMQYVLQNDFWSDQYSQPVQGYPANIIVGDTQGVTFRAPTGAGPVRLYVYARDGHGAAATANIPLYVSNTAATPCVPDLTSTNANPGDARYGLPDGTVDGADLSYFVEHWLGQDAPVADLTTTNANPGNAGYGAPDGTVDGADLSYYVEAWLGGCS